MSFALINEIAFDCWHIMSRQEVTCEVFTGQEEIILRETVELIKADHHYSVFCFWLLKYISEGPSSSASYLTQSQSVALEGQQTGTESKAFLLCCLLKLSLKVKVLLVTTDGPGLH